MTTESQHAEIAFFSSIMNDASLLDDISEVITTPMFSSIPHKSLYEEIIAIRDTGLVPEYSFLISELISNGKLEACGGEDYLGWIKKQNSNGENFQAYVRQIIDAHKTREVLRLSANIPILVC